MTHDEYDNLARANGWTVTDDDVAGILAAPPRRETLTQVIEADKAGMIAHLSVMQAERMIQARRAGTQRESRRLVSEANGIELAIHSLHAWDHVVVA